MLDHQQHWYRRNILLKRQRIVDVGANVGVLSQFFWDHCGAHSELISVEPHPANIKALEKRIKKAGSKRWSLKRCAVSSSQGSVTLRTVRTQHGDNAQIASSGDLTVPCQTLMQLAPDATVLKIDIEGHEYQVLPDAVPALSRAHTWALELHMVEGHPLEETLGLFAEQGYRLIGAGRKADGKDVSSAEWVDVDIPPTLGWDAIPGSKSTCDGLPSIFKMLHVIAKR